MEMKSLYVSFSAQKVHYVSTGTSNHDAQVHKENVNGYVVMTVSDEPKTAEEVVKLCEAIEGARNLSNVIPFWWKIL
jgi:hypothetical protein